MTASAAARQRQSTTSKTRKTRKTAQSRKVIDIDEKASLKRLREFVAKLPAEFLECRQYNHAWTGYTVKKGRGDYTVTLRCLRCKSYAVETLDRDGNREGKRSIRYVEGYLAHGMGRLTGSARAALRLEGVSRVS